MLEDPLVKAAFAAFPDAKIIDEDSSREHQARPWARVGADTHEVHGRNDSGRAAAQTIQKQMEDAQSKLDAIEVEGAAGGGLVRIKASAKGRVIGVSLDESLLLRRRAFSKT
jgi:Asp/Glu/hydantoin racemase